MKGNFPVAISMTVHPRDQMSACDADDKSVYIVN